MHEDPIFSFKRLNSLKVGWGGRERERKREKINRASLLKEEKAVNIGGK